MTSRTRRRNDSLWEGNHRATADADVCPCCEDVTYSQIWKWTCEMLVISWRALMAVQLSSLLEGLLGAINRALDVMKVAVVFYLVMVLCHSISDVVVSYLQ